MMETAREADVPKPNAAGPDLETEIARLEREHRELKARLSELNSRLHLSVEEETERKTIQKLKLLKKDRLLLLQSQRSN